MQKMMIRLQMVLCEIRYAQPEDDFDADNSCVEIIFRRLLFQIGSFVILSSLPIWLPIRKRMRFPGFAYFDFVQPVEGSRHATLRSAGADRRGRRRVRGLAPMEKREICTETALQFLCEFLVPSCWGASSEEATRCPGSESRDSPPTKLSQKQPSRPPNPIPRQRIAHTPTILRTRRFFPPTRRTRPERPRRIYYARPPLQKRGPTTDHHRRPGARVPATQHRASIPDLRRGRRDDRWEKRDRLRSVILIVRGIRGDVRPEGSVRSEGPGPKLGRTRRGQRQHGRRAGTRSGGCRSGTRSGGRRSGGRRSGGRRSGRYSLRWRGGVLLDSTRGCRSCRRGRGWRRSSSAGAVLGVPGRMRVRKNENRVRGGREGYLPAGTERARIGRGGGSCSER